MKKETDGKKEIRKRERKRLRKGRENDVAVYIYLRHGAREL